jgi:hypothetical protein
MKRAVLFTMVVVSIIAGCKKSTDVEETPACLEESISVFQAYACDTGAAVKEYKFQGKTVYALEPGNCGADMQTEVIDSVCTSLGALGGLTGNTKINGKEFSTAIYIRTVWHN